MEDLSNSCDEDGGAILEVECGKNKAKLYVARLCQGSKGPCILFRESWLTPNEFQYVSGRQTAKDWKRSIRHEGKSLKLLLSKGVVELHPNMCVSEGCRKTLPKRKTRMGTRRRAPLAENGELAESNRDDSDGNDDQNGDSEDDDLKKTSDGIDIDADNSRSDIDTDEDTRLAIDSDSCEAVTEKDIDSRRRPELISMQDTESASHGNQLETSSEHGDKSPADVRDTYSKSADEVTSECEQLIVAPLPASFQKQHQQLADTDTNERCHDVTSGAIVNGGEIRRRCDENVRENDDVNIDTDSRTPAVEKTDSVSNGNQTLRFGSDVCVNGEEPLNRIDDTASEESKKLPHCQDKGKDSPDPTGSVISQNGREESNLTDSKETAALNIPFETKYGACENTDNISSTILCGTKNQLDGDNETKTRCHDAEKNSVCKIESDRVTPIKTYPAFVEPDNTPDSDYFIKSESDVALEPNNSHLLNSNDVIDEWDVKRDTIDIKKCKPSTDSNKNFLETRSVLAQSSNSTSAPHEKPEAAVQPLSNASHTPLGQSGYVTSRDNVLNSSDKQHTAKSYANSNSTTAAASIKSFDKKESKRKCRLSAVIDSLRTSKEKALESSSTSPTPLQNDTASLKHHGRADNQERKSYAEVTRRRSLDVTSLYNHGGDKATPAVAHRPHVAPYATLTSGSPKSINFPDALAQKLPSSQETPNKRKSTQSTPGNSARQPSSSSHRAKSARDQNKRSSSHEKTHARIPEYAALPPRFPCVDNRAIEGSYLDLVQRYNMALAQQHLQGLSSSYGGHLPVSPYPFPNGASYEHLMLDPMVFYSHIMQQNAPSYIPNPHTSPSQPESSSHKRGVKRSSSSQSNTSSQNATHNSKTSSHNNTRPNASSAQTATSRHSEDALDLSIKKRKTHY